MKQFHASIQMDITVYQKARVLKLQYTIALKTKSPVQPELI